MKEIPKKNYYILVVLLIVTVLLTLLLFNVFFCKEELVSNFYKYSNKIKPEEFDEYITENTDTIIYISDKFDLTHETFEKKIENKLNELNLKENMIFIDKNDIDSKFINKLEKTYGVNVNLENTPLVIIIIDEKVVKNVAITPSSSVDTIIENEVFE